MKPDNFKIIDNIEDWEYYNNGDNPDVYQPEKKSFWKSQTQTIYTTNCIHNTMTNQKEINKEMELLPIVGKILNGYSKTFRQEFCDKPIVERIKMYEQIIEENGGF